MSSRQKKKKRENPHHGRRHDILSVAQKLLQQNLRSSSTDFVSLLTKLPRLVQYAVVLTRSTRKYETALRSKSAARNALRMTTTGHSAQCDFAVFSNIRLANKRRNPQWQKNWFLKMKLASRFCRVCRSWPERFAVRLVLVDETRFLTRAGALQKSPKMA